MPVYDFEGNKIDVSNNAVNNGCDNTGVVETSSAIQKYINENRFCYFPSGTYLMTAIVYIPSNTVIYCEPNTVFKRGSNITCMFTSAGDSTITEYNGVHDILFHGATFDQNGENHSYNCTSVAFVHAQRVFIENCKFINQANSWHQIELSACKHSKIRDCYFDCSPINNSPTEAIQIECPYNSDAWPWSNGAIDRTPSRYNEVSGCVFYNGIVAIGNHGGGVASYTDIHDCVFDTFSGVVVQFYGGANNMVHDCTAIDCASDLIRTNTAIAYNNYMNGTFTA